MLRNVLEDYLSSINERDFDYPLTSLLHAKGFYDIHFTHGNNEIGKDFIAKKFEDGVETQYAIQSKKGNINQTELEKIQGQLFLASISGLSHPQFNKNLPRRVILVTTGRLVGTASTILQDFNNELKMTYQKEEIVFWGKEQLIPDLEEFGLSGIYKTTAQGLKGFAQFYLIYSKAIEGSLSDREIEEFSRLWNNKDLEYRKRILRAAIEAEIIVSKLFENGFFYEAITVYLCLARTILQITYENEDKLVNEIFNEIVNEKILPLCKTFFQEFIEEWESEEKNLLHLCLRENSLPMLQYIVWCSRVLELSSLYCFLEKDENIKNQIVNFLIEFIEREEGCGHIPSDKYTVSVVWAVIALLQANKTNEAVNLVKRGVVWLCDRVENGFGLARYEADEYEETITLLGYPFDWIKVDKNHSYFFATALNDLAAFISDKQFYSDVFNDLAACEIVYNYWQFPDTNAILTIENEECLTYPNIPFDEELNNFEDFNYASHIKNEPREFQIVEKVGKKSLILLSILLKDRYFPTMWKKIISEEANGERD